MAYDGTNYHGWQIQPNGVTIEEVLNYHLSELLKEPIRIIGASRTDAGVHARGNVAVFDTSARMPAEDSREVRPDFHPRFCETVKTYEYCILNRKFPDPTRRLYALFHYYPLNLEKMRQAAEYLVGEHDFKSLCTQKPEVENTVRTIYSVDITKEDDLIRIRICGNGFLYNMIRIIVGTLLRIGSGYYEPEYMKELLELKDRQAAGETAPPQGLTLVEIRYPEEEKL